MVTGPMRGQTDEARAERPAQGPVASLSLGLRRLRELGFERPTRPAAAVRQNLFFLVLLPVGYVFLYSVAGRAFAEVGTFLCMPVAFIVLWLAFLLMARQAWRFERETRGMLVRTVRSPSNARLAETVAQCVESVGLRSTSVVARGGSPLTTRRAFADRAILRLPDLGASLMVTRNVDPRMAGLASDIYIGPVTDGNVGGIVRLAEAMEERVPRGRTKLGA